ncbi:MAG: saccharopine dehydrogenase family protein [Candidatus Bathyarchaeia archaeon]
MKIIVLGCGNIGSVAARDLAESLPYAEITLSDINENRAKDAISKIGRDNVSWMRIDASNHYELVNAIKKFDLAIGSLPGALGYKVCLASVEARVDLVDVSYMPEDVMTLHKDASKAQVSIIPDCGMSPGLSNILIGHAVSELDSVESVYMLNGGLPEKPIPPLGYVITWSVQDLIDMYHRKVNIVKDGKIIQVDALSGLEEIEFPKIGKLEAFYTDGLRTLLHSIKGVKEMWEKSLRHPGHVEKIRLLKDMGFFDEKTIKVGKAKVSPRAVTAQLLESKLKQPNVPDIVVMHIKVFGKKGNGRFSYIYQVFDRYDSDGKVTAMARTTAYTTSIVAQLLANGLIKEKGVIPPEKIGMNGKLYKAFIKEIEKRKIMVEESKKILG